jgi:hypothetical protein
MSWLKRIWKAMWRTPYGMIAANMQMEGYTDFEIGQTIEAMKKAEAEDEQT